MKRTILPLSIATAALLGPAAAAQAAPDVTCVKASVVGISPTALGTFVSSTTGDDCTVQLSSWSVPDTYDGKGYDASAKPQTLFDRTVATLTGTPQTVSVKLPASRWCQIDYRAANGTYLYGRIVECHPPVVVHPKPPVVTPPKTVHHPPTARVRAHAKPTDLPKQLAFTGFDTHDAVLVALLLVVAGVGIIAVTVLTEPARRFNRQAGQR